MLKSRFVWKRLQSDCDLDSKHLSIRIDGDTKRMDISLIPNLPDGIVEIQWGPDNWLMYRRNDLENNSFIGIFKLGAVPLATELKLYHQPLCFAVNQATGRYAIMDHNGLLLGEFAPESGLMRRVRLPNPAGHPHSKVIWSGDGHILACRTTKLDETYLTGMLHSITVISYTGLTTWSRSSSAVITNFSLSASGLLLSTEGQAGKNQVDFYMPFNRWDHSLLDASAHSFSIDGSRSAWIEHRRGLAELRITANFDNSKSLTTYQCSDGNEPPSQLVWSSTGRLLFANPKIDWQQGWMVYDFSDKKWRRIAAMGLQPLVTHPISTSPDDKQAVIMTEDGPAIVTF